MGPQFVMGTSSEIKLSSSLIAPLIIAHNVTFSSPTGSHLDHGDSQWQEILLDLNQSELHKNRHLVLQVRKGIPTKIRGQLWWSFVKSRLKPLAGHYTRLLASGNIETAAAKQIELDIVRTLPGHRHFGSTGAAGVGPLRRVLLAYSRYDPEVGYCQGLNRLAAVLLLCLGEEEAFWALVCIVTCLMPCGYYTAGLEGARADLLTLQDIIQEKLPRLWDHLSSQGAEGAPLALGWLLCAFADCLPPSTYLRVWDSFLLEGHKVLLRYALALFKYCEEEVLKCEDAGSSLECLQRTANTVLDADQLAQIAFCELNPFSQKMVNSKREKHLKALKEEALVKAQSNTSWTDDSNSTLGNSLGKRTWSTGPS
ncbi:TBC1 domain family member 2B-like [Artemia franciscana]|uniref:TBC1 domain family member 2B-like n=1 Tax=Artemia franciscana TaxID=6661 RepID=UPI0032DB8851